MTSKNTMLKSIQILYDIKLINIYMCNNTCNNCEYNKGYKCDAWYCTSGVEDVMVKFCKKYCIGGRCGRSFNRRLVDCLYHRWINDYISIKIGLKS